MIFNFEMTRSKKVAQRFFKDYGGILHTDGYVAYEKDIGAKEMIHACCWSHSRRGFIDALKVQQKTNAVSRDLERTVVLMDGLFCDETVKHANSIYRWMRVMRCVRSVPRHPCRIACAACGDERIRLILPQSVEGKAIAYTLKRWMELTVFLQHPEVELSTNLAENSMRSIALGRRNWLHLGSKEAGPKIAAIFSIVGKLPQARCADTQIPGRRAAWPCRSLHPGTGGTLSPRPTPPRTPSSLSAAVWNQQPM